MPSANTTAAIDALTVAMQGIGTSIDSNTAAMTAAAAVLAAVMVFGEIFELALLVSLLVVSLRAQEPEEKIILSVISGAVTLLVGLLWLDDYPGVAVVLWFLAAYQIGWRGLITAVSWAGPSEGLAQFKGVINQIREAIRK